MEANLLCEQLCCQTLVFSEKQTREETAETVVPDTMPDIAELLDADARVYLRSKEIRDGKVTAEAQIAGTILYLGEEDCNVQRIELNMPCAFSFDMEEPKEDDKVIVRLRVINADARSLNPRKLLLRTDVRIDLSVYRAECLPITAGAEEREGMQTLISEETVTYASAVTEKSFVISEELAFSPGSPAIGKILLSETDAAVEEIKSVGGKLILQGTAGVDILYLSEGENELHRERLTAPFSQIIDTEEGAAAEVYPLLTASYTEPLPESYGVTGIHLEMHMSAQVLCRRSRDIRYLADAYSVKEPCSVRSDTLILPTTERETVLRETLRESAELAREAGEIVSCRVFLGAAGECEGGVSLPVSIHVLYKTENGDLAGTSLRRSVTFAMDTPENAILRFGDAKIGETVVTPSGSSIEVRMSVEIPVLLWEKKEITMLTAVELDEETPLRKNSTPSVIVVRYKEGSIWSLAKKYASTAALIESANPFPIQFDDLLLIPRAR